MNRINTDKRIRVISALTNGFSKKLENHGHALALYFLHYNFCKVHQAPRVTPAMEAGIADHVWSLEGLVALLDVNRPVTLARER